MALINHAKKEINAKIVYYGLAGSGKSTALSYIYSRIKPALRGELKNIPAGADNLNFFDFSPFELPLPNGYRVRLHLYTLTGIVTNPATWKMTLKGTDGIIIMVNPATGLAAAAKENVLQLRDFLSAYGVGLHEIPAILQLNSFSPESRPDDAAGTAALLDLDSLLTCHANAVTGEGLLEALTTLSRQLLDRITVIDEPVETNIPSLHPAAETTLAEPPPVLQAPRVKSPTADIPQIALLSQEVVSEGTTIRIPLEITHGGALQRFVITVNIDSGQHAESA